LKLMEIKRLRETRATDHVDQRDPVLAAGGETLIEL